MHGLKMFLFYDDVEEFLVIAGSREDAFVVVDEYIGEPGGADELIMSKLVEYTNPKQTIMKDGRTVEQMVTERGRCVVVRNIFTANGANVRLVKPEHTPAR